MKLAFATCLLLGALTDAVVGGVKRTVTSQIIEANYDDSSLAVLPEVTTVGVYRGLRYSAFSFINLASPTSGSTPQSNPNGISTALVLGQVLGGTPSLSVDYPGSKSPAFDLISFFFGCVSPTAQGAVQLAEQCSILVAGFDANNKEKAVATFTFTPPAKNLAKAPMIRAILPPGFTGLRNVTVIQTSPLTQVLLLDNTKYRLYTSS